MRRCAARLAALALVTGLAAIVSTAGAAPPDGSKPVSRQPTADELPNPAEEKRRELREVALQDVIKGNAKVQQRGASKVVKVGKTAAAGEPAEDQYVELTREKTDKIFVILAEFGNERHPQYPDQDTNPATPGPAHFDGPQHDQIPAPDRAKDNSTVWQPDYEADHYRQLYFGAGDGVESVKTYYERQSSGRYSVDGTVTDWVRVPFNEARYGRSNGFPCASNVCSNTWQLIKDAIDTWVADQHAAGRTDAQIAADLASYDQWDRNDFDHDGNFNEADGYIDHFQIVHSGGDQADGDPSQGEDAIWSHRWKAFQNTGQGPENGNKDGGTQIGTTGLWIADYTIQPENGGVSVFAHEYAHDLGLPDLYDTSGGGENGVNWWSIMAQSRVSAPQDEGIGTRAADLGAWEKLQLGWLDYEVVGPGRMRALDLGPHEYNSAKAQGVVVVLPQKEVVTQLGAPAAGSKQWWSGQGDELDHSMTRELALPAGGPASLTFQANWNIEDCGPTPCDYAYVEVDDGSGFKAIPGSITNAAERNGIDGDSKGYKPAAFDLSAFAGKTIKLRFRYVTDPAAQGTDPAKVAGLFVDEIKVTANGTDVFTDGAETSPNGWTLDGFSSVGATKSQLFDNYYVASNREYVSFDRYLQSGPYNFAFPDRPDWVEHFPYQDGLLVSYWDTSVSDNNTSEHPGQGEILAIDSHPEPIFRLDGKPWRSRIQGYDATFALERADSFTLHAQETGRASFIRGQNAQPLFDDRRDYWDPAIPTVGVKVPHAGLLIRVLSQEGTSMRIRVQPAPAAAARD